MPYFSKNIFIYLLIRVLALAKLQIHFQHRNLLILKLYLQKRYYIFLICSISNELSAFYVNTKFIQEMSVLETIYLLLIAVFFVTTEILFASTY